MQSPVPFVQQSLCLQRWVYNGCTVRFVYRIFEYSFVLGKLDSLGFRIFVLALSKISVLFGKWIPSCCCYNVLYGLVTLTHIVYNRPCEERTCHIHRLISSTENGCFWNNCTIQGRYMYPLVLPCIEAVHFRWDVQCTSHSSLYLHWRKRCAHCNM